MPRVFDYGTEKMSTGGLEPPQISPHAPQACASTIPPRRHFYEIFNYQFYLSAI